MPDLNEQQMDDLARRVAGYVADEIWERLQGAQTTAGVVRYVDAKELALMLGVSPRYVRDNAKRLGGEPLGAGKKPRWRFDPEKAQQSLNTGPRITTSPARSTPRKRVRKGSGAPLLPVVDGGWNQTGADGSPKEGDRK